jgi:hypothetical protein
VATKTAVAKIAVTKISKKTAITMAKTTNKSSSKIPAPTRKALELCDNYSPTDVNGSYTGKPKNEWENPVQDADDL